MQLLRSASQIHPAFKLNVGDGVLHHCSRDSSNEESVCGCCNGANGVFTGKVWFLPSVLVIDTISLRLLINMESILFACLFLGTVEGHDI